MPVWIIPGKRRWALVIFIVAVLIRATFAWVLYPRGAYRGEAEWIGMSLAARGEFAGAYAIPTGPTAHCGPFYTGLVSILYWLLGAGMTAEVARIGLLILINS